MELHCILTSSPPLIADGGLGVIVDGGYNFTYAILNGYALRFVAQTFIIDNYV